MPLPEIAIVGRPNVGKSSLFNSLVRLRVSIAEPTAGVTRDRVSAIAEVNGSFAEFVDTGGHGIVDRDDLGEQVEQQIRYAIDGATVILFVVDGREGLHPLDRATAELLRRKTEQVRLVANKIDEPHMITSLGEFQKLGFGIPLAVSARNGFGQSELRAAIGEGLGAISAGPPADPVMKIALVGRRNVGKSSFINALAGEPRVIVSENPGTTRDSIDVCFERDGRTLVTIDTAGLRKESRIADDIEYFSFQRAVAAIHRSDVVLFLIDSTHPVGQVDKRLAQLIAERFKPCVLVVNKWDLAKPRATTHDYGAYLDKVLPQMGFAPVVFTSAFRGRNTDAAIDVAAALHKQSLHRVGTGRLNQTLQDALSAQLPPTKRGQKAPKFFYATQIATAPPTLMIFVNAVSLVTRDYQRFLLNRFRDRLPFAEIPIRLVFRARRASPATRVRAARRQRAKK